MIRADIAIVGAGMAGASLAAAIGDAARVVLLESEAQPGYHATGRSAAFWTESYGGPAIQPLTSASGPVLAKGGFLKPRGALHIADRTGEAALDAFAAAFAGSGVVLEPVDRVDLEAALPRVRPGWRRGLAEPSCRDIDVAALHAAELGRARAAGAVLVCGAAVDAVAHERGCWRIETRAGTVVADILVDAAGAWADAIAALAGAQPIAITPMRRTIVQLALDPPASDSLPLVLDADGRFYFKGAGRGRIWLSPHDETPVAAQDAAPDELDIAVAIDRLERVVDWRVVRRERAWAGLRSFAPDRAPVYGFDARAPGFFWYAGQGGFGIQTAPAAAVLGAALLLGRPLPDWLAGVDADRYAPSRFG